MGGRGLGLFGGSVRVAGVCGWLWQVCALIRKLGFVNGVKGAKAGWCKLIEDG